jgi:hypothetical protein
MIELKNGGVSTFRSPPFFWNTVEEVDDRSETSYLRVIAIMG